VVAAGLFLAGVLRMRGSFSHNIRTDPDSPPWKRRGGRDINKNVAKPPLMEGTGAERKRDSAQLQGMFVQLPINRWLERTAPSAP